MIKIQKKKIYIIMYHYVRDVKISNYPNLKALETKKFIEQINFFSKNFNLLNYNDFNEILSSKKIPLKPSILLTFDDGYIDHYENVFPILHKKKASGIFYVPIRTLENKKVLDVNKIHFILEKEKNRKKILHIIENSTKKYLNKNLDQLNLNKIHLNNRWDDKDTFLIKKLLQFYLKNDLRTKIINKLFKKLIDFSEKEFSKKIYMNKKHLTEMKNNNMHFGIHGFDHFRLGLLSPKDQKKEISESILSFKKMGFDTKDLSICYPYGSYNNETLKIVKNNNFKFGVTLHVNKIGKTELGNPYELPRFDCNDFL